MITFRVCNHEKIEKGLKFALILPACYKITNLSTSRIRANPADFMPIPYKLDYPVNLVSPTAPGHRVEIPR
jgi:hypothetical protein